MRNKMQLLLDHASKPTLGLHSRAKGSQLTAVSRDRVEAALLVAMTKPARCHIMQSGAARFGHPPKGEEAVCKRRAWLS